MKLFATIFLAILAAAAVVGGVLAMIAWHNSQTKDWISAADANHAYLVAITESCLRKTTIDDIKKFNQAMDVNREIIAKDVLPTRDSEFYDKQALQIYDQMKEVLRMRAPDLMKDLKDPRRRK